MWKTLDYMSVYPISRIIRLVSTDHSIAPTMPNKFLALAGAAVVAALLAGCVTKVIQAPPSNNFAAPVAKQQPNAYFGQRHALVIGNANYAVGPLRNPLNDASDMAAALEGLGFEVQRLLDADASAMERAIIDFNKRLSSGGVGLFYYAGHGIQAQGSNYLIPLRAGISSELQLKHKAINAGFVLDAMEAANKGVNIVILDACRDNPYESSFRSNDRGLVPMNGLAPMNSPKGSLIAYATAPGGIAADGEERNGLFTQHLLAAMQQPNQLVELTFKDVAKAVSDHSGGQQTPFVTSSLTEYFYFNPSAEAPPTPAPSGTFTTSAATNPAPTNKFTPSSIDGLSLDEWLLVHGNEPKTLANLDKVAAYQSQHGGNAASRSYIDSGLTELLAAGVGRSELIRLKKRFPTSATLRLQLADEFHSSSLFEAALAEYQSWLDLADSKHPEREQVQLAMLAAKEGRSPRVSATAISQAELIKLLGSTHSDYTKLDAHGSKLPSSAKSWSCVLDNRSGLIWEVKTNDGGARDKDNKYRWGGKGVGDWDGKGVVFGDWNRLVDAANSEKLCGFSDWRVPDLYQLASLVRCRSGRYRNLGNLGYGCTGSYQRPAIAIDYFPNAQFGPHWSASPYANYSGNAWQLYFNYGYDYVNSRNYYSHVRLVRVGQ